MRNFRKLVAATAVAVSASMALGTIASAESISGSGATFPQTFLASATTAYNASSGHSVSYANPGGGSTKGKTDFKAGLTDFGGTDSAVSSSQAASFGWTYIPYVAGGLSVAYRLDEIKGTTLQLKMATVAKIFSGKITKWNDPLILADMDDNTIWANSKKKSDAKGASVLWQNVSNTSTTVTVTLTPAALKSAKGKKIEIFNGGKKAIVSATVAAKGQIALALTTEVTKKYSIKVDGKEAAAFAHSTITMPDKSIIVTYRSDGSGTTNNFIKPLNAIDSTWTVNDSFTTAIPGGQASVTAMGAAFQGQSGSAAVSNYVADTNGSIGYTEVSFVTDATRAAKGMNSALIQNAAGKYTAPTSAAVSSMLADSDIDSKGFVTFNFKQTTNATAYQIVAVTYLLGKTAVSDKNAVVSDFAKWMLTTYAPASAESLGYAALTGAIYSVALNKAKTVNAG